MAVTHSHEILRALDVRPSEESHLDELAGVVDVTEVDLKARDVELAWAGVSSAKLFDGIL